MSQREKLADSFPANEDDGQSSIPSRQLSPSAIFPHPDDRWEHSLDDLSNLLIVGEREWVPIGPQPLISSPSAVVDGVPFDFGSNGKGPSSGEVTDIAIDPSGTTDQIIYIAAGSGGIWKTTDGGQKWAPKTDMLRSLSMGAVAVDPIDPTIVYAGTGNLFDPGRAFAKGVGIYKSIDGGETWAHMDGGAFATIFANSGINRILVLASNVLMVATNNGLFRSVDGGLNFGDSPDYNNGIPILHGEISSLTRDTIDPDIVYAAVAACGVIRLKDRGATFDKNLFTGVFPPEFLATFANLPSKQFGRIAFGQSRLNEQGQPDNKIMYASVQHGPSPRAEYIGLFRSDDSGENWDVMADAKKRIDSDTITGTPPHPSGADQTGDNLTIGVDPQHSQIIYVSSKQLWFSPNGGENFLDSRVGNIAYTVANGEIHFDHHAIAFSPHEFSAKPTRVYTGTDGGLATCKTDNGDFWDNLNKGVGTNLVRAIAIGRGAGGRDFTYCGMQDTGSAGLTPDTNLEWIGLLGGDGSGVAVDPSDPRIVYGFTDELFAKIPNNGKLPATSAGTGSISTIKDASPHSPIVITTHRDHPYLTGDQVVVQKVVGNTAANNTDANKLWKIKSIDQRRFSLDGSVGIPGSTSSGGVASGPGLGRNLENPSENYARCVALEQNNPDPTSRVVYVSEVKRLFKSTDAGGKFTRLQEFEETVTALTTTRINTSRIWVGLKDGTVHYSSDGGVSWDLRTLPGGVGAVDEIAVDPTNVERVAIVYSGQSGGNSVFRTRRCFLTSDNGETWNDISGTDGAGPSKNLPDIPLHSVVWDTSTSPPSLIVASDAGVMRSTDLGASWHVLGANLPTVCCQSLAIDNSVTPPLLRVGTYGRSCFELRKQTGRHLVVRSNLAFGTVLTGQSAELPVQLFNVGDAELEITNFSHLVGDGDFGITPAPTLPLIIEAGGQRSLLVRFQPLEAGNRGAVFGITSNDASDPSRFVFASGWNVAAPTSPRLAVDANLTFGPVSMIIDRTLPVQISNTGLGPLLIKKISRTGGSTDFELVSPPTFPLPPLQPGEKHDLTVRFKPSSAGPLDATFEIESDDLIIRDGKPAGTRTIKATGVGKSIAGDHLAAILIVLGVIAVLGVGLAVRELKD